MGSGGPHPDPDPDAGGSAFVITVEGRNYLVDCGHGATRRLIEANINPASIDKVFLSHLHYDHCIDVPLFARAVWPAQGELFRGQPQVVEFVAVPVFDDGTLKAMGHAAAWSVPKASQI